MLTRIEGKDIQVGDVIETWMGRQRVIGFKSYDTKFSREVWPNGVVIAEFDSGKSMTIARDEWLNAIVFRFSSAA